MESLLRTSKMMDVETHEKARIVVVDDHPLIRDAIKGHLQNQPDMEVIQEAGDGEEAVKLALELNPDVVIMDIAMPKLNGLEAIRQIKGKRPQIAILVLTVHGDAEYILKALEAGAAGYLTKSILGEKLAHAIRLVVTGESVLSDMIMDKLLKYTLQNPSKPSDATHGEKFSERELEIFRLAARGMSNKQISQALNLNLRTVKGYFESIFAKLSVGSRTEAVVTGLRMGYITLEDTNIAHNENVISPVKGMPIP